MLRQPLFHEKHTEFCNFLYKLFADKRNLRNFATVFMGTQLFNCSIIQSNCYLGSDI